MAVSFTLGIENIQRKKLTQVKYSRSVGEGLDSWLLHWALSIYSSSSFASPFTLLSFIYIHLLLLYLCHPYSTLLPIPLLLFVFLSTRLSSTPVHPRSLSNFSTHSLIFYSPPSHHSLSRPFPVLSRLPIFTHSSFHNLHFFCLLSFLNYSPPPIFIHSS